MLTGVAAKVRNHIATRVQFDDSDCDHRLIVLNSVARAVAFPDRRLIVKLVRSSQWASRMLSLEAQIK